MKSDIKDININKIHLVCFENSSTYYADENTKIMKYDFFKNPYSLIENNSQFFSLFNKILDARDVTSTVFIDSINVLMYMENTNGVYSILKTLKDGFKNVKCVLHTDIVEDCEIIDKINFFSNMVLKLHAVLPSMSGCGKYIGVDGVYQKSSGKIKKLKEVFHVDSNYNVHSKVCDKENKNKNYRSVYQNLKSLTTFRLGLDMNESERIARDNLVLPYLRYSLLLVLFLIAFDFIILDYII